MSEYGYIVRYWGLEYMNLGGYNSAHNNDVSMVVTASMQPSLETAIRQVLFLWGNQMAKQMKL